MTDREVSTDLPSGDEARTDDSPGVDLTVDGTVSPAITGSSLVSGSSWNVESAALVTDPAAERRLLIELLIYAWDRARSPGVWERLAAGLAQIGVLVIRPDGQAFDPSTHEVGGVQNTTDPLLHNTIAETESVGFADRGRLIREPVVVVYRLG